MRAAFIRHGRLSFVNDAAQPAPAKGQVLLRLRLAAICGTDLALLHGYADFNGIPGHEFVAEVVQLGEGVDETWLGKRVAVEINQYCGNCALCRRRAYSHCLNRRVIGIRNHDGAFAEYLCANVTTLHPLPDSVSDEQAVFVEPLAAAFRIVKQLGTRNYNEVLVIGAGRLGQLIARVIALQGAQVALVCRHESQRRASSGTGVHCISAEDITPLSADVVVEACGQAEGFATALRTVRPGGAIVLKSTYREPISLDMSQLVIKEIELIGSRCGPFASAIEALADGRIDPIPLIEARYRLNEVERAFEHAAAPGAMKILIQP